MEILLTIFHFIPLILFGIGLVCIKKHSEKIAKKRDEQQTITIVLNNLRDELVEIKTKRSPF